MTRNTKTTLPFKCKVCLHQGYQCNFCVIYFLFPTPFSPISESTVFMILSLLFYHVMTVSIYLWINLILLTKPMNNDINATNCWLYYFPPQLLTPRCAMYFFASLMTKMFPNGSRNISYKLDNKSYVCNVFIQMQDRTFYASGRCENAWKEEWEC